MSYDEKIIYYDDKTQSFLPKIFTAIMRRGVPMECFQFTPCQTQKMMHPPAQSFKWIISFTIREFEQWIYMLNRGAESSLFRDFDKITG